MPGEEPVAAATMRIARSLSFADPARRSTIHGPNTLPEEANAEVAVDIDAEGFVGLLLERIASLG